MQATAASSRPGSVGSSARRCSAMNSTSSGCTSRSIVSRRADLAAPEERRLHPAVGPVDRREAVELQVAVAVDPDRLAVRGERADAAVGLEPVHDLALDRERHAQVGQHLRRPRAGADTRWSGGVGAGGGGHPDAVRRRPPTPAPARRTAARRRGARPARGAPSTVCLGPDEPGDRLVQPHLVVRRASSSGTGAGSRRRRGARAAGPTPGRRCRLPATVGLSGRPR